MRVLWLSVITSMLFGVLCLGAPQGSSIFDVQLGAPADRVLAGLADRYTLTKLYDESSLQVWSVRQKSRAEEEWYELAFDHGKVFSVSTHIGNYQSEDAVRLANRFFNELYQRATADKGDDKAAHLLGVRYLNTRIQLQRYSVQDKDEQDLFVSLGNDHTLRLEIVKEIGQRGQVGLAEIKSR